MSANSELDWFKSSYSGSQGDSCVEVAHASGVVHVRDSKAKDGPQLVVRGVAWRDFVGRVER
ncbi:DUF397 domain-containing protein [Streptomyces sp. CHD11]|uniref:DUF397 domain-containing protein n=1 Tax=Streptomyces sp. CHD11 TaxID=2741325 RepID=UPI001BFC81E7|nr:DUF397 domain-containing protein [Streptomyces sp. CHD11]MBT3149755.1 DUF397 domain-containing protein [Streptomyces sp. CHD11]